MEFKVGNDFPSEFWKQFSKVLRLTSQMPLWYLIPWNLFRNQVGNEDCGNINLTALFSARVPPPFPVLGALQCRDSVSSLEGKPVSLVVRRAAAHRLSSGRGSRNLLLYMTLFLFPKVFSCLHNLWYFQIAFLFNSFSYQVPPPSPVFVGFCDVNSLLLSFLHWWLRVPFSWVC